MTFPIKCVTGVAALLAGALVVSPVSAADGCTGDGAPVWNERSQAYAISDRTELEFLDQESACLDDDFYLSSNIDLSGSTWDPIDGFSGSFDGRGRRISGLTLTGGSAGLFNTESGAHVFDLRVESVSTDENIGENVGSIVGLGQGELTLEEIRVSGVVDAPDNVGGLVGLSLGTISVTESSFDGTVTATEEGIFSGNAGGLVGQVSEGIVIRESSFAGQVEAWTYAGGLVGSTPNGSAEFEDVRSSGGVTSLDGYAGGLVGLASEGATVTSSAFDGDISAFSLAGGLVGIVPNGAAEIDDIVVEADVTSIDGPAGGFVALSSTETSITSSSFSGNVTGVDYSGGLVGLVPNGAVSFEDVSVEGSLSATGTGAPFDEAFAGGLIGLASEGLTATGASFVGDVSAPNYAGGLAGDVPNGAASLENVSVEGSISATGVEDSFFGAYAGGVIGLVSEGLTATGVSFVGDVSALTYAGGLAGMVPNGAASLENVSVEASISATETDGFLDSAYAGGVIGSVSEGFTASGVTFEGDVSAMTAAGGLAGLAINGVVMVEESVAVGSIVADDGEEGIAGGLLGSSISELTVSTSYFEGEVTSATAGGIVGQSIADVSLDEVFAAGNVTASDGYAGGLAGEINSDAAIENSFFNGDVSGDTAVGGLVGSSFGLSLNVNTSYAVGSVASEVGSVGGLVGESSDGTVTNSFCVGDDCPESSRVTAEQLKSRDFLSEAGWDFENIWCVSGTRNDGFPVLRTISAPPTVARCLGSASRTRRIHVSFDPNGGVCTWNGLERSAPWGVTSRTAITVPSAEDCRRPGHVFEGWVSGDPAASSTELVTESVDSSAILTARWSATAGSPSVAPTAVLLYNFFCGPCDSVLLFVLASSVEPSSSIVVTVDGVELPCEGLESLGDWRVCQVSGLVTGREIVVSVAARNPSGTGPGTTTSVLLK